MLGKHSCALYIVMKNSFQKRLQAPGAAPGAVTGVDGSRRHSRSDSSGIQLPEKRLPAPENGSRAAEMQSRFFGFFLAPYILECLVLLPRAAPGDAIYWHLPESSRWRELPERGPRGYSFGPRGFYPVPHLLELIFTNTTGIFLILRE